MQNNNEKFSRSYLTALGAFLCVCGGAFAVSLLFYTEGTVLFVSEIICVLVAALGVVSLIQAFKLPKAKPLTRRESTVRLTVTAVMLACVALSKIFRLEIPMMGGAGMTVGFSGVFTSIPALLFGPMYGAMASACSDILGCIISPIGPYNPLFTLTAFLGGFIKGSLWLVLKNRKGVSFKAFPAVAAVLLIVTGIMTGVSVKNDGISQSFIAQSETVVSRATVDSIQKSPLSNLVTSLASYTKDTYTVTSVESCEVFTVPSKITVEGLSYTSKIGKNGLKNITGHVYIPSNITSIDKTAFADGVTVHIEEKTREVLEEAEISNVNIVIEESVEKTAVVGTYGSKTLQTGNITWQFKDAYAQAVAKYINYLALGPIIAGGSMLAVIAIGMVVEYIRKKQGSQDGVSAMRVLIAVFGAGLVSTTVNTLILQYITYPSWASRAFYIVWVPRVAEELIVCSIQAYFVALLYDFYMARKPSSK